MGYGGLAATTFMAGPDDAQAAADAFANGKSNAVLLDNVDYSLSSAVSPVNALIKPPSIKAISLGKASVSPYSLTSIAPINSTFAPVSAITRMTTGGIPVKNCIGSLDSIAKSLLKIPGDLANAVIGTVNGITNGLKNLGNGFGNLNGIGCITNSLTDGNFNLNIKDKGALSGLISGVTIQGSGMGVNNIFSSISNVVTDKDVLLSASKNILPYAVKDIGLLKNLSSTSVVGNLRNIMPNLSSNTISNFQIPSGTTSSQLPSVYGDLSSTLSSVDPNWNNVPRNNVDTLFGGSLTSLQTPDFHNAMSCSVMDNYTSLPSPSENPTDPIVMPTYQTDEQFLMVTKDIGEQSVSSCLATDLPNVPVTVNPEVENTPVTSAENVNQVSSSQITQGEEYSTTAETTYEGDVRVLTTTKTFPDGSYQIKVVKFNSDGSKVDPYAGSSVSQLTQDPNPAPVVLPSKPLPVPEGTLLGTEKQMLANNAYKTIERFQGPVEPPYTSQWINIIKTTYDASNNITNRTTESELIEL